MRCRCIQLTLQKAWAGRWLFLGKPSGPSELAAPEFCCPTSATTSCRTISPVQGCFYEFSVAPSGSLGVVEVDSQGLRLQLLEPGGAWGAELPVRLRELHSHWLSRWAQ